MYTAHMEEALIMTQAKTMKACTSLGKRHLGLKSTIQAVSLVTQPVNMICIRLGRALRFRPHEKWGWEILKEPVKVIVREMRYYIINYDSYDTCIFDFVIFLLFRGVQYRETNEFQS